MILVDTDTDTDPHSESELTIPGALYWAPRGNSNGVGPSKKTYVGIRLELDNVEQCATVGVVPFEKDEDTNESKN